MYDKICVVRIVSHINIYDFSSSGYIPPEYINEGLISTKFDIFSLGVVIIKIMTGREGYFRIAEMPSQQFIRLVRQSAEIACLQL
jgi:interleukin-1 receptor-associated kinase 1/coatomer subunit beta'